MLGRSISADEARDFTHIARRLEAICLAEPQLDGNYAAVRSSAYKWPEATGTPKEQPTAGTPLS